MKVGPILLLAYAAFLAFTAYMAVTNPPRAGRTATASRHYDPVSDGTWILLTK